MSFPRGTEMFQFPRFAFVTYGFSHKSLQKPAKSSASTLPEGKAKGQGIDGSEVGFPIRKSSDQSLFAAPQGLSQRTTSFIASQRQGIHQIPLSHLIALINRCPSPRLAQKRAKPGSPKSELSAGTSTEAARLDDGPGPTQRVDPKTFASKHVRGDVRSSSSPPPPPCAIRLATAKAAGAGSAPRSRPPGMLTHAARPTPRVGHIHSSRCRTTGAPRGTPCASRQGRWRIPDGGGRKLRDGPRSQAPGVARSTVPLPGAPAGAVVEPDGIEPTTSCLQSTRSPN